MPQSLGLGVQAGQPGGRHVVDAPRRPDGPPVRGGLPYSAIAHLAEDVQPFVAMSRGLRERGLSAPHVYAANLADGLLFSERARVVEWAVKSKLRAKFEL